LTNLATVRKSINRLKQIELMRTDGTFEKITKKEIARLLTELAKLNKNFAGIVNIERMPKAMFVVDVKKEDTAIKEAKRLGIPVIALIDTNSNPEWVAYPIPGNDDATKSIRVVVSLLADAIIEGRKRFVSYLSQEGVAVKSVEPISSQEEVPLVLPEEEMKIQEIEEIVETKELPVDDTKAPKKARVKPTDDKARPRK
jgi:small subunit ribosomal protein S2